MDQREYLSKYIRVNLKTICIRFHKERDADIIEQLERVGNKSGYIKQLIREDIPKSRMTRPYKISFVTNAEEAKKHPIMKKKDADKIAKAFKRLQCDHEWVIHDDCEKFIARCKKCGAVTDSRLI